MGEPATGPGIPGVQTLDHTADVGLEVVAADFAELLRRAAQGLTWLLLDRAPAGAREERTLRTVAESPGAVLRELLRELLWWHDSEGVTPVELTDVRVEELDGLVSVAARAVLTRDPEPPAREIKGVTLHGLVAERRGEEWYGRVIFDV